MKKRRYFFMILIAAAILTVVCVSLMAMSALYLYINDIEILDDFPSKGHTWSELNEAYSKAQYGGYYNEHDRYMSEVFADAPWFGYARYDIYTQTMTIYLNEDTEEHRDAVNAYIADNDHGGCIYQIDTCTVSYGNLMSDDERMQRIYYLLRLLGANRCYLSDGTIYIELREHIYAPAAALIHLMTKEKEALVYSFDPPQQIAEKRSK